MADAPRWLMMEEWLDHCVELAKKEYGDDNSWTHLSFTVHDLAGSLGIDTELASALIRSYLTAQRGPRAKTAYILHRSGRTSNANWQFGIRKSNAAALDNTLFQDILIKIDDCWAADLARMARLNPRLARHVQSKLNGIKGAVMVMAAALDQELAED